MTLQLQIDFRAGLGASPAKVSCLFADMAEAQAVSDILAEAAKAYHDRANDRERLVSFKHLTGTAVVDVSEINSIAIDDALGEHRAEVEAWNVGCAELHAAGRAVIVGAEETAKASANSTQP